MNATNPRPSGDENLRFVVPHASLRPRTQCNVIDLNDMIYARAVPIVFAHALRADDADHIASALATADAVPGSSIQVWTADRRQADAAAAAGLDVRLVR